MDNLSQYKVPAVISSVSYMTCSAAMVLVNKALVTTWSWREMNTLLVIQSSITLVALFIAHRTGWIHLHRITLGHATSWMPVVAAFIAMLYTGTQVLAWLPVPIVTVCKNATPLIIAVCESLIWKTKLRWGTTSALVLVALAAAAATVSDMAGRGGDSTATIGYVWMACNIAATACYVLLMKSAAKLDLNAWDKTLYNNFLLIPAGIGLAAIGNELPVVASAPQWGMPGFLFWLCLSGVLGLLLSASSQWCVTETSATTIAMVGALNKIPTSVISVFLFHAHLDSRTTVFVALSLCAGVVYAWSKAREQAANTKPVTPAVAPSLDEDEDEDVDVDESSGLLGSQGRRASGPLLPVHTESTPGLGRDTTEDDHDIPRTRRHSFGDKNEQTPVVTVDAQQQR